MQYQNDDDLSYYKTVREPGLEGRRFAVRVNDLSLSDLGIRRGDIVLAIRSSEIEYGELHVLDIFSVGIVIRTISECPKGDYACVQLNNSGSEPEGLPLCVPRSEFYVLGHVIDLAPQSVETRNINRYQSSSRRYTKGDKH